MNFTRYKLENIDLKKAAPFKERKLEKLSDCNIGFVGAGKISEEFSSLTGTKCGKFGLRVDQLIIDKKLVDSAVKAEAKKRGAAVCEKLKIELMPHLIEKYASPKATHIEFHFNRDYIHAGTTSAKMLDMCMMFLANNAEMRSIETSKPAHDDETSGFMEYDETRILLPDIKQMQQASFLTGLYYLANSTHPEFPVSTKNLVEFRGGLDRETVVTVQSAAIGKEIFSAFASGKMVTKAKFYFELDEDRAFECTLGLDHSQITGILFTGPKDDFIHEVFAAVDMAYDAWEKLRYGTKWGVVLSEFREWAGLQINWKQE